MATISNIIKTIFTSAGADKVVKDTESVNRSQTRLGQTSAGAGRQFAAQASGLGGLVGAYAGAAATVFALQAAFTALNNAAKAENVIKGTNALAASISANGPKLLQTIKDLTNGQLTLAEAAQSANIALSAGFNTKQIEGLTVAAVKTSKALGRDLTDSFTRLVRGTSKLEPELLDELGIFVRIEAATKKYAKANNVATNSLTEFERRQAFLSAALDEVNRKFSAIDASAPSAQQSFERLAATIQDLAVVLGNMLNQFLKPLADFFANDLGNAVVLFGGILLTVFSKARAIVGGYFTEQIAAGTAWANNYVTNIERVRTSYTKLAATEAAFNASVVARKGLLPKITDASGVTTVDRTGSFSQKEIPKDVASRLAALRQQFKNQEFSKMGFDQLTAISAQLDKDIEKVGNKLQGVAKQDALAMQTALTTALTTTTTKTKILNASVTLLGRGLRLVGTIATGLFSAFNWVFGIVSIFELLGVDVFGTLIGWFQKSQKEAESFRSGLVGAFTDAAGGAQKLTEQLMAIGSTQEQIDNIGESIVNTYQDLGSQVQLDKALSSQILDEQGVTSYTQEVAYLTQEVDRLRNMQKEGDSLFNIYELNAAEKSLQQASTLLEGAKQAAADRVKSEGLVTTRLEAANRELAVLSQRDISLLSVEESQRLLILQTIVETLKGLPEGGITLIGGVSKLGGLDSAAVTKQFKESFTEVTSEGEKVGLLLDGIFIKYSQDGNAYITEQTKGIQDFLVKLAAVRTTIDEANASYLAGTATVETLGKQLGGLRETIKMSKEETAALVANFVQQGYSIEAAIDAANRQLDVEKAQLEVVEARYKSLKNIETLQKGIQSTYSGEIKLLDTVQWDGLVSLSGKFAESNAEIANNRVDVLKASLDTLKVDEARLTTLLNQENLTKAEAEERADLIYKSEAYNAALKAGLGIMIQSKLELEKITKEQEKKLELVLEESKLSSMQNSINLMQAELALAQTKAQIEQDSAARALQLDKARLATQQQYLNNSLQQLDALSETLTSIREGSKISPDVLANQYALAEKFTNQFANSMGNPAELIAAGQKVLELSQQASASKQQELTRQKAIVDYERVSREAIFAQQLEVFDKESMLQYQKILSDMNMLDAQLQILDAQEKLDIARTEAQKAAIIAESAIVREQINGYATMASVVTAFGNHIAGFADVLRGFLEGLPGILGANAGAIPTYTPADLSSQIQAASVDATNALSLVEAAQIRALNEEKASIAEIAAIKREQLSLEKTELVRLLNDTAKLRGEERAKLISEQEGVVAGLTNELADLESAAGGGEKAVNKLKDKLLELYDSIKGNIETAITSLNDLVFYGEGNINEIFGNLFKSIQQDFFKTTIADPLSGFLTDSIFSLAGLPGGRKGIENAKVLPNGALMVSIVDGPAALLGSGGATGEEGVDLTGKTKGIFGGFFDQITGMFSKIFGQGGFISNLFGKLFGGGGILSGLFKGIGGFFSMLIGRSQGGLVHLAAGGAAASATLNRDRVPAMLEPGEFVIRKQSAERIGMPALQAMNATGDAGAGGGNVFVNVTNEGSPKQAEASSPRFDGEKYVIDIVMRDIANNGPIRRSLRGRGGL